MSSAQPCTRTRSPVPAALDAACLKALARAAGARFSSAGEFREALAQGMRAQPSGTSPAAYSGGVIDYAPLATAMAPGSTSASNSQALVAAVLVASDAWERSRLIDPLERALREALGVGDFKVLRTTITVLQEELKAKGPGENLKLLFDMTRDLLTEHLPLLLEWLADEPRRPAGRWLLLLLGRRAVGLYLRQLPGLEPALQQHLMEVLRTIDPDGSLMVAQLRGLDPQALKPLLVAARGWTAEHSAAVFNAALQSPDAGARQAALESLDEANAFRFGVVVRQRLHDPSLPVRAEALRWVFRMEDEAAVPELARLLERSSVLPMERKAVWRTLSRLKTDAALELLSLSLNSARDLDDVAELARALVRTNSAHALAAVRAQIAGSKSEPRRKAVLEEALRVG